jgi:hypothetical protein
VAARLLKRVCPLVGDASFFITHSLESEHLIYEAMSHITGQLVGSATGSTLDDLGIGARAFRLVLGATQLPMGQSSQSMKLTTYLHLVQRAQYTIHFQCAKRE